MDEALLDGVVVARLKELTENIRTRHDLVRVPALTDLRLAKIEKLERELIVRVIDRLLQTSGRQQLLQKLEQRHGDSVHLLVVFEHGQNTVGKSRNLLVRHPPQLGEHALAGVAHQPLREAARAHDQAENQPLEVLGHGQQLDEPGVGVSAKFHGVFTIFIEYDGEGEGPRN